MFYLESQLEEFIIENWDQTELGQKYDLIKEDGELVSQQYHTDVGIIDILAKDKVNIERDHNPNLTQALDLYLKLKVF